MVDISKKKEVLEYKNENTEGFMEISSRDTEISVEDTRDYWNMYFSEGNQEERDKLLEPSSEASKDEIPVVFTNPDMEEVLSKQIRREKLWYKVVDTAFRLKHGLPLEHRVKTEMENDIDEGNLDEDVFEDVCNEETTEKVCYDDNGKIYRCGDELTPNSTYEINGYTYTTDEYGRIVSVEGTLHIKEHEGRLPIRDNMETIGKGDQQEGDDRGHLIGDQFDGSNGMENMIPQEAHVNRNDFRNFENELAKVVKEGKEVIVKVEPIYEGDSRRPEAIVVTYSIDGEEGIRIFPNNTEDGK